MKVFNDLIAHLTAFFTDPYILSAIFVCAIPLVLVLFKLAYQLFMRVFTAKKDV